MQIHLSGDTVPIYQQIVDQIRQRIVSGSLSSGSELPTIRGLAEMLRVNPNTVQRAYRELEQAGLVEKRRTRGTFVADWTRRETVHQRRKMLTPHVDNLLIHAKSLDIAFDDMVELLRKRDSVLERDPQSAGASR
ncbi:MAG: GntR family transcriptional regulator [Planctomycetota bacterium]